MQMQKYIRSLPEVRRVISKLHDILVLDKAKLASTKRALNISALKMTDNNFVVLSARKSPRSSMQEEEEDGPPASSKDQRIKRPPVKKATTPTKISTRKPVKNNDKDDSDLTDEETPSIEEEEEEDTEPQSNGTKINVRGPAGNTESVPEEKIEPLDPSKIKAIKRVSDLAHSAQQRVDTAERIKQLLHTTYNVQDGTASRISKDSKTLLDESQHLLSDAKNTLITLANKHAPTQFKTFATEVFNLLKKKTKGSYKNFKIEFLAARGTYADTESTMFMAYLIFDELVGEDSTADYYIVLTQVVPDKPVVPAFTQNVLRTLNKKEPGKIPVIKGIDPTNNGFKVTLNSTIKKEEDAKKILENYKQEFFKLAKDINPQIENIDSMLRTFGPSKEIVRRGAKTVGINLRSYDTAGGFAYTFEFVFQQRANPMFVRVLHRYKSPVEMAESSLGNEITSVGLAMRYITHSMMIDRLLSNANPMTVPLNSKDLVFKNPYVDKATIKSAQGILRIFLKSTVKTETDAHNIGQELFKEVKSLINVYHPHSRSPMRMQKPQKYKVPVSENGRTKFTEQYIIDFSFQQVDGEEGRDLPANRINDFVKTFNLTNPQAAQNFTKALKMFLGTLPDSKVVK